jgi:hypothetical protein
VVETERRRETGRGGGGGRSSGCLSTLSVCVSIVCAIKGRQRKERRKQRKKGMQIKYCTVKRSRKRKKKRRTLDNVAAVKTN